MNFQFGLPDLITKTSKKWRYNCLTHLSLSLFVVPFATLWLYSLSVYQAIYRFYIYFYVYVFPWCTFVGYIEGVALPKDSLCERLIQENESSTKGWLWFCLEQNSNWMSEIGWKCNEMIKTLILLLDPLSRVSCLVLCLLWNALFLYICVIYISCVVPNIEN